ncbi:endolytic transglycosylase MltG [Hydrogenispora ethanolica]|jgi:UPF0755 protein|nr:endolytic transglycosylase MltG [Hydrogenispora ethanolica]
MQKIASWFRTHTVMSGIKSHATSFWRNHPLFGGGLAIFGLILTSGCVVFLWNLFPMAPGIKGKQVFEIEYGTSLRQIGNLLQKQGIIRSKSVFEFYIRFDPRDQMLRAGRYRVGPGMSLPEIVRQLRQGTPFQIRVTIPEGFTVREVVDLLSTKGLVDRKRFLDELKNQHLFQSILGDVPMTNGMEGYLFPDTYYFDNHSDETEIIATMLRRFKQLFMASFQNIPQDKRHDLVILASLVEKEARKAEERPVIAGVFQNRLQKGYPLQSCATVEYALGVHKERLSYKDIAVQSPFNTYLHRGLPPGPIANPGLASLKAAADPATVSYLYFVAKPDGTHVFSNTFEQHLQAQKMLERARLQELVRRN